MSSDRGPLNGIRVLEFGGLGPAPFCAMLLGDLGADLLRIDRPGRVQSAAATIANRSGQAIELDLKSADDRALAGELAAQADILIEGYRPGVMERLGLGPEDCHARNPRVIYGRMTGWGQEGPLAQSAGHDINYIAISGALASIGPADRPVPPLNLVGDYGGGGVMLGLGLLAALVERQASGQGQVVELGMSDGAASLMSMIYGLKAAGTFLPERQANMIDGGAHYYQCYQCADGKWISVGAIEPQFYSLLLELMDLPEPEFQPQNDRARWPEWSRRFAEVFLRKTRAEWCEIMEGTDACFAPVLDMNEAPLHPHNSARGTFATLDGVAQPTVGPRFSRTRAPLVGKEPMTRNEVLQWFGAG